MKHRISALLLALLLTLSLTAQALATAPTPRHVVLSPQNLTVDGVPRNVQKYNIDDYNYFKLRDIAYLINGTGSQFAVGWDEEAFTVSITTGGAYVPNGGELALGADLSATTVPSTQSILVDGVPHYGLNAYNIGGENYFKLRDLGVVIGFDVQFDPSSNTAAITTRGAAQAAPEAEKCLTVGGKIYFTGMTEAALTGLAGAPAETLASVHGWTWYVYGTATYLDFLLAGVCDGKVVTLVSGGWAFSWMDNRAGAKDVRSAAGVTLYTDKNDGGVLHAVRLLDAGAPDGKVTTAEALRGESVVNFHMTNAFRVYHGLPALVWDEKAAEAARLHSEDMAKNNYFEHDSQDGRSPWQRMEAQGVRFSRAAENIAAGYGDGVAAYNGWVNSAGHRSNMLGECTRLGVGCAYNSASSYGFYMTQDYYSPA